MNKGRREEPSITRVAQAAGVSLGTVSRVMNGAKSVNQDLRARVLCAAREIGFVHRAPSRRLGIVVGRRNPLLPVGYTHIMTALIDEFAYARGMAVEQFDVANLERAWESGVAAVIGVVFDDAMLKLRGLPNLPVLSINHPMAEMGIHSVYTDHLEQGMMAAQHLLDCGHERIAFLGGLRGEWGVEQRLAGYRAAMSAYGQPCDPAWVRFSDDEPVYDIVQRWVKNGVTGILNFSEDVVAETLHVLSNVLRKRIGVDISTITLEDVPLYQYFTPPPDRSAPTAARDGSARRRARAAFGGIRRLGLVRDGRHLPSRRTGGARIGRTPRRHGAPQPTTQIDGVPDVSRPPR